MSNGQTIIIKRPKIVQADGHHGGAWKVAYADFVTAMMAFFLLMWLLNATTEEQRRGLADYFNPSIPVAAISGGGADALGGEEIVQSTALSSNSDDKAIDSDMEPGDQNGVARDQISAMEQQDDVTEALKSALDGENAALSDHISIRVSPEGLVIELTDRTARPLFASGRADASPVLEKLSVAVAQALEGVSNNIKIVGHTDSRRFAGGPQGYTNWELSSDRANSARRMLKAAGLDEGRITEVSGQAATMPLVEDPLDPRNRRISITLLR